MSGDLNALRPVVRALAREGGLRLHAGMGLAVVTALAGLGLLALSGWFITATALAGLTAAAALAFDVFVPGAGVRGFALLRTAARYGERVTTHDATLKALAAFRERLFRGWARPQAARTLLARPARLLFRLTSDVDALDALYLRGIIPLVACAATAAVAAILLSFLDFRLGLAAGGALLVGGLGVAVLAARAARRPTRRRAYAGEALRARVVDMVRGQTELVMAGRLAPQTDAVMAADARQAQADDALNRIEVRAGAALTLLTGALLAGVLAAAAHLAEGGTIGAPIAAMALLAVFAAVEPFGALRRGALEIGRAALAAKRLAPRLSDTDSSAEDAPVAPSPEPGVALRLAEAAARHAGDRGFALAPVTLTLRAGERVAIVGPSGAGKSTLMALMAGEIAPAAGSVTAAPAAWLSQRTTLFRDSLRDNLRLAAPDADDARLRDALSGAGLGAFAGRLDAPLGEGGMGLSGGQSRRLALARLLLSDAPLWLLDEPTDGLDGPTARDVLRRLVAKTRGRTLVVATHLRREADVCDRVIVLEGGRVVADLARGAPDFRSALDRLRPD
ncbi:ABC transporter permease [Methylopila jiangsuensis]|uniref:ABC transporter permease n=1 Tax=Methylopila jiangsuensis TaxID=586230 RepID=A0A9W6JG34_9HYPH|nr:ATP-binding cassette domain-containing protein [Methylopila jiangsuensis]MDR6285338.1 ATP-binding cassette subfamily C protein CydC [Methylopila jiangsuensis]GLK75094.1 ABC transporter permease [Methylopila jiangsuensis]